jgi:hypothetical protein
LLAIAYGEAKQASGFFSFASRRLAQQRSKNAFGERSNSLLLSPKALRFLLF